MANESGVVFVASYCLVSTFILTVDNSPTLYPALQKSACNSEAMVVFPFVPVTPINFNFEEGLS